ncbi:50S ribosomal protein L22 [Blattabacterium sp. (Blattella germanica) str. Bge]|uniref:50S ribosomal protein L22 n=1 Tax=Blattabacterium sp. (Blattella germanica) TaxID=624186 RepID=UPI0001BB613D|nr:50S ribosomal protein L22 [Blattabacterium sp. (Blattella germanica)]ACY40263.1 50S ribosomal protein L22 [Blattabacterium sp. (Blattella germanica) str. Bge]
MKQETNIVSASLNGVRCSPRKMRSVVDLIRNKEIQKALDILTYSGKKRISFFLKKLLISLLSNWKQKYEEFSSGEELYIKEIKVNQGKTLKRLRPVPQGRGHRIRKKSSHVLVFLEKRKEM